MRPPRRCSIPAPRSHQTGQFFAYARDDRPGREPIRPPCLHLRSRSQGRASNRPSAGLHRHAAGRWLCRLPGARREGGCQLAFCWAHVRRKFYELAASGPAPIATEALERIAALYRIEGEIRGRSAEARRLVRQERARPLLDALEAFLRDKLTLISQKTKLAEAIRYALSRWEGLSRFLDDGRVDLDNNTVERSIRPARPDAQERALRRIRRGCPALGRDRHARRNLQAQRRRSAGLPGRCHHRIVQAHPNRGIDELMPWRFEPVQASLADVA